MCLGLAAFPPWEDLCVLTSTDEKRLLFCPIRTHWYIQTNAERILLWNNLLSCSKQPLTPVNALLSTRPGDSERKCLLAFLLRLGAQFFYIHTGPVHSTHTHATFAICKTLTLPLSGIGQHREK
jgi:hypothetical protein